MGFLYLLIFPNGKFYVGLTTQGSVSDRFAEHRSHAKGGKLKTAVYNAWRKHGEPTLVPMGEYPNEELPAREIHLIASLNTRVPNGYNVTEGGDCTAVKGWRHSEDAKARISAAVRARGISPETRAKMAQAMTGRKLSPETIAKRTAARAGWKPSAESVAKRVASRRGYKHSPETIEKMRATQQARRAETAAVHRGRKRSPETRARMRAAQERRYTEQRIRAYERFRLEKS